uniref:D-serine dehydratase-like domain-containing protein n=1 Tax=Arion vulgaris TaxID=1028688 RepID=A0A0B7AMV0_9EUPU
MAKKLKELATPCFLIDIHRVRQNCQRMLKTCKELGVQLRPHTKSHKTLEIAEMQTNGTKRCIVVSTLAEAEFYAENGFDDILLAYPITEEKIQRCLALLTKLQQFHVFVSGKDGMECLENHVKDLPDGKVWSVVLELDAGLGRTGFVCDDFDAIYETASKVCASPKMRLESLYYHCGDSSSLNKQSDREKLQATHIDKILHIQNSLKEKGITCKAGVGSTATCSHPIKDNFKLSEFHTGSYIFNDYNQVLLNSCTESDIACCVMTRVIAHKPEKHMILVDCGYTALSHDGKYPRLPDNDFCIIQGENNLRLIDVSQVIGKIVAKDGKLDLKMYPVGTILYIYPYRANSAACMHSVYYVHFGNDIIATWKPVRE